MLGTWAIIYKFHASLPLKLRHIVVIYITTLYTYASLDLMYGHPSEWGRLQFSAQLCGHKYSCAGKT